MYTIEFLEKEHEELSGFVDRIEDICIEIMNGAKIEVEYFRAVIKFIRKFADEVHHKKEEDILFKYMVENLGKPSEKLINYGMLAEHQMARYYVMEWEKYLNNYEKEQTDKNKIQIIGNAMSYVNLLRDHIEKENGVAYPFGKNNLPKEILDKIDKEMEERVQSESKYMAEKLELLKVIF